MKYKNELRDNFKDSFLYSAFFPPKIKDPFRRWWQFWKDKYLKPKEEMIKIDIKRGGKKIK